MAAVTDDELSAPVILIGEQSGSFLVVSSLRRLREPSLCWRLWAWPILRLGAEC